MRVSAIIPVRFLTIIFHLMLLIIMLQGRDENVKVGLPLDHNEHEFAQRDMLFSGGLIAGVILTVFELLSFFSGISMFASVPSLISILCHSCACILLGHLVLHDLDSQYYWLVFTFCSIFPSLFEVGVLLSVLVFQKSI